MKQLLIRGRTVIAMAVALVLFVGGPAFAAWNAGSSGAIGYAKADSLPAGSAPTSLTRLGRDLDVTWPQVSFRGQLLGTYGAGRYSLSRNGTAAGGACAGALSPGASVSSTCREAGMTPGSYAYKVTPSLFNWNGTASSTTSVTIPSPSLTFSPAGWSGPTTPLQGTVDAMLDGSALSYRLDDPNNGAVLTGTLTTFPTAPSSAPSTSVSVGCGRATPSTHNVYLAGGGEQAAGAFTFDFSTVLCPASIASTVGTTAGQAQAGDAISITFSQPVNGGTICSGLTAGHTTPGSLLATIVDGGSGNDTLTVSAPAPAVLRSSDNACGSVAGLCIIVCLLGSDGTVTLGTLDLGSTEYAKSGNVTFGTNTGSGATLSLDSTGTVLTITLGNKAGATNGTAPAGSIAKYSPASAIKSATGISATGYMTSGDRLW